MKLAYHNNGAEPVLIDVGAELGRYRAPIDAADVYSVLIAVERAMRLAGLDIRIVSNFAADDFDAPPVYDPADHAEPEWREIGADEILDAGCHFVMDIESGKNLVRV
jgi:hypothetical protein